MSPPRAVRRGNEPRNEKGSPPPHHSPPPALPSRNISGAHGPGGSARLTEPDQSPQNTTRFFPFSLAR